MVGASTIETTTLYTVYDHDRRERNLRCGVTVVESHAKAAQKTRQERQPLLPCCFKAREMCPRTVNWLLEKIKTFSVAREGCSWPRRLDHRSRIDRVVQVFVEESGLQNPVGPEIMLHNEVVIFRPGGLECRITCAVRCIGTGIGIQE